MTMKRRDFAKLSGLGAVVFSTTGFVRFNGTSYEGDCITTTDILGPFYRPNSPERGNLVIRGIPGDIVQLSGTIRKKDCQTPHKNAKVELWHCSSDEIYDNDSDEFRYRGTTHCDENGRYEFTTQMPVPYDAGGGLIRPAHFHLLVSAEGYQSLITQIYFHGDSYLDKDPWAAAAKSQGRVLDVTEEGSKKKIVFDCNMNDRLKASYSSLNRIVGKYKNDQSDNVDEYFEKDGLLWQRNEVFGESYNYIGENTFEYDGMPKGSYRRLQFELNKNGSVLLNELVARGNGKESKTSFTKI